MTDQKATVVKSADPQWVRWGVVQAGQDTVWLVSHTLALELAAWRNAQGTPDAYTTVNPFDRSA